MVDWHDFDEFRDLRVRIDADVFEKACAWLTNQEKYGGRSVILAQCFEAPRDENPHFHLYVRCPVPSGTIKKSRTRFFHDDKSMKGNGPMCIQDMDEPQRYKEYLCKGVQAWKDKQLGRWMGQSLPQVKIFDTEVFTRTPLEYNAHFWETHVEFRASRAMKSKTFTERCIEHFEDEYKPGDILNSIKNEDPLDEDAEYSWTDPHLKVEEIIDFVTNFFVTNNRGFYSDCVAKICTMLIFKYKQLLNPSRFKTIEEAFRASVLKKVMRGID